MEPIVDGLAQEFGPQVAFWRVEAETAEGLALQDALEVRGHPTLVVLDGNGRVRNRFFGPQSAEVLREALQRVIP